MKTKHLLLVPAGCVLLASCGSSGTGGEYTAGELSATPEAVATDSASAPLSLTDPARKILRTADLRCRVSDAYAAASRMEGVIRSIGGTVSESKLEAIEASFSEVSHGADSLKQFRSYTTTAHLTLRVPVASLDSVVQLVPQGALFLHQRTLAQEDATLRYLAADLKNKTPNYTAEALQKARKTEDVIQAAAYDGGSVEHRIDRHVQNLDILDRAAYATLTVEYYQPQSMDVQVVVNPEAMARVPFSDRAASALRAGWQALEGLVILLVAFWPLWLLGIAGWALYRALRRKPLMALARR